MAKSTEQNLNNNAAPNQTTKPEKDICVVGIGASAGGLEALEALFSSVPQDSVAYIIVQHLSPVHRSYLAELLSHFTLLKIVIAEDNMPIEANKVYIIPNKSILTVKNNRLHLQPKTKIDHTNTIDTFFTSLAADKKDHAIGIILSGTGNDGTKGAEAIKNAGGLVLVQSPETAKFDAMPLSVAEAGFADHVIAPELMPAEIYNFIKLGPISNAAHLLNSETESFFHLILELVHDRTGIDFSNYKQPTIIRRISRRMAVLSINSLIDYLDYLNLHPEEAEKLGKEFLIGVTKFFRDKEAYQVIADKVIPELVNEKKDNDQLRIWVAGCSSGEEAYSLAILVWEYLSKIKKPLEVKIFASDIDREALEFAGRGLYPEASLTEVSEERLNECFVREEGKFRINQRIRRMVIFAPHNVINDPPFSRIDMVSCRNMLIYLNPVLQRKVIDKFHYSLVVGGYLFLGSSESIGNIKSFEEVSKKWKIFRNTEPARSLGLTATFSKNNQYIRPTTAPAPNLKRETAIKQLLQHSFSDQLSETILEESGFAAVYIDEHYDVLHGAGKFKNFLDLPEQQFTFNLLKLVPQDLAVSLGTMLRKAIIDKQKIVAHNVQVRDGNNLRHINIIVKPFFSDKKLYQKYILVLFSEEQRTPLDEKHELVFTGNQYENRVQELEIELQYTKDDLQAVVEELETANEELQSMNEELLSSNEELQSTNEELQSVNEELHTINAEHQYKIKALMELDDDLNNYFRSTDIGQIFVDRKLIIRKYTPAATRLINLIESDIGRSIYHLSNNLQYDNFIDDVMHVASSTYTIEKEVQDKNGIWYQMRILPYITQDRKIDGVIIIFVQINELKTLQLLHAGILDSSPNAIIALKSIRNKNRHISDFTVTILNYRAQRLFNHPEGNLIGKTLWKEYPELLEHGIFERLVHVVETGEMMEAELPMVKQEKPQWLHIVAVKFDDGLVLTLHDITDRKLYEQTLQQQKEELSINAEKFRTLLEAIPHITWTNKPNGENSTFNDFWYNYTGLTEEESAGWGWIKAFHPEDLEVIIPQYKHSLQTGEIHNTQARIKRKADNTYRWHIIKDVPIRNKAGEITLWIGTATDIQDQKDAEQTNINLRVAQQREIMKAVLQTQEQERVRLSEALHNGLGQILYAARLNLDSLPVSSEKLNTKKNLEELMQQAIKITRNISFELTPSVIKDFGLKTAVEESIKRFTTSNLEIKSKITGIDHEMDSTTALSVYRIVQELLNNIVKHSGATKASVAINVEDNNLLLSVKDNGKGIASSDLETIKGIGLSSIQNRVDMLEGKMKIKSSEGKGTQIEITCKI